ncbi:MAG: xanthine dehydrogenase family protein molybdopterin-binding subunit [Anaerolineae bacterium]|nr:xanthine dehydrogenase family protein molybdopterin-binding subunit [Anaerolineae bacterium]
MANKVFGKPIKRKEDPAFIQGAAPFVADMHLPGMAHMEILRSPHAHARIRSIDTSEAAKMPGVLKVISGHDLVGRMKPLPCVWIPGGVESHFPLHPQDIPGAGMPLQTDHVRFIGDGVAAVVAETRYQAMDALRAIRVEYDVLPAVITPEAALVENAPLLHDSVPGNLNAYWTCGDQPSTDAAIADAEVVVELDLLNQRTINSPIEPRGALATFDPVTDEFVLYASTQSPHNHRLILCYYVLNIPLNKLRIIAPNVGGSFGTKGYVYPDMPLVLFMARELKRPVKWQDSRQGYMRSTVQGRDHKQRAVLAGTRDGKITALHCTSHANLGAYPSTIGPGVATAMMGRSITGPYAIPAAFCEVYAAFTNTVPLGAQRGSGRSEATFMTERLVDLFAAEIGMDPAEVRRRNFVQPGDMPYDNGLGWLYDSGDYPELLERALKHAGYDDLPALKEEAKARGRRMGVGLASFVAVSGVGPSPRMAKEGMLGGTWEAASIRCEPTGDVVATIGSKPHGQSHDTVFAQIISERLGVAVDRISIRHSDTLGTPFGQGSYGSRSFSMAGPALYLTCDKILQKACLAAAHKLNASPDEMIFENGRFYVDGQLERGITLLETTLALWYAWDIPDGVEPCLEATTFWDAPDFNYPSGAQVALVEVDPETGEVELKRFIAVSDVGVVGNPMVMEGQLHGGIVHGLGQALFEQAIYDADGNLISDTLERYALPKAAGLPHFELDFVTSPTPHNPLGVKGAGEIGTVGATAAVGNAICDALREYGVRHIDMPFTPEKVWRAIHPHGG